MVRATHGVYKGSYYFEVEILPHTAPKSTISASVEGESGSSSSECPQEVMPSPHIRIGWSTRQGELQAPVGFDQYSYGYRDSCGKRLVHRECFYFYIRNQLTCYFYHTHNVNTVSKHYVPAGSKSHKSQRVDHYGEPYQPGDVIGCHIALNEDVSLNSMSFYRNGVDQGVAYRGADIPAGIYFPAVSLYMKVTITYLFCALWCSF